MALAMFWFICVLVVIGAAVLLFGAPLAWVFGFVSGLLALKAVVLGAVLAVLGFGGLGIVNSV